MSSEHAELRSLFYVRREEGIIGGRGACSEKEDLFICLEAKRFESNDDGDVFMKAVMSEVEPLLFGDDVCFGFEATVGRASVSEISDKVRSG